ncbi:MAG: glutamate dehydrogenase, partial [Alphaproteobacteria bacterium]|nr:glutamate dehydrogenase [Alphaproteobacteria bacterium]
MDGESSEADTAADQSPHDTAALLNTFRTILVGGALPGEVAGLDGEEALEAARFVAAAAEQRASGVPVVQLESVGGRIGRRRMRLAVVNDDMPFLVDSVTAAISARNLIIH